VTIIDILNKFASAGTGLVKFLEHLKQEAPDLSPLIDDQLMKLATAVSTENLVALATALPAELAQIVKGKTDGRSHPGDAA